MYNIQGGKEGKPRSGERLTIKHESTYYLLTSMKLHLIKGVGLASYQIRYIIFSQRHLGATFHRALAPGDAHAHAHTHTHALLHCSFSLSSFLLSHCRHTTSDTLHTRMRYYTVPSLFLLSFSPTLSTHYVHQTRHTRTHTDVRQTPTSQTCIHLATPMQPMECLEQILKQTALC